MPRLYTYIQYWNLVIPLSITKLYTFCGNVLVLFDDKPRGFITWRHLIGHFDKHMIYQSDPKSANEPS